MPNCKVTIANIRKHCDLSDEVEKEILESECARMRCQRLLNVMLENLNADKDYMKFCYLLFLSTVATDLACYLISSENYLVNIYMQINTCIAIHAYLQQICYNYILIKLVITTPITS